MWGGRLFLDKLLPCLLCTRWHMQESVLRYPLYGQQPYFVAQQNFSVGRCIAFHTIYWLLTLQKQ